MVAHFAQGKGGHGRRGIHGQLESKNLTNTHRRRVPGRGEAPDEHVVGVAFAAIVVPFRRLMVRSNGRKGASGVHVGVHDVNGRTRSS